MDLVYIGEHYSETLPSYIRPFHNKETGKQLAWSDLPGLMLIDDVNIRPATDDEFDSLSKHAALIQAAITYLSQFSEAQ